MKWDEFISKIRNLPVIDTEILLAGLSKPNPIKVQISRWQKAGKLIQLKRGVYVLAEPYRKIDIYEYYVASLLKQPSYLSLEKAMEYYNLIPEAVSVFTSITTKRPTKFINKLGTFDYRHIKNSLFWGYESIVVNKQTAFIASPEKALLDFFYLKKVKISFAYLDELRLQNLDKINPDKLSLYAKKFKKPGILGVSELINKYIKLHKDEEKEL